MIKTDIISYSKPKSVAAEAYRALRTNLEFSLSNGNLKTILITSSHSGEGKSSTASNLATVFAMQNKKTVLIDADMRRGIQHNKFGISNDKGLSNYLANVNMISPMCNEDYKEKQYRQLIVEYLRGVSEEDFES